MHEPRQDNAGKLPYGSARVIGTVLIAITCVLTGCLAFILSAASFGILSLPIILVGLVVGWFGKTRWIRWPGYSAVISVLAMYLYLISQGR